MKEQSDEYHKPRMHIHKLNINLRIKCFAKEVVHTAGDYNRQ